MIGPSSIFNNSPATYISSLYIPKDKDRVITKFMSEFKTISVLSIDAIIDQVNGIIEQVSKALEVILGLTVFSAAFLTIATIQDGFNLRLHQSAILRTFGASSKLLQKATALEFALLGLLSGLLGALLAQVGLYFLETEIFETIRAAVIRHSEQIINTAKAIGEVDAIVSLAEVAVRNSYVRPTLSDQREIRLVNSRHPLVESTVLKGNFVGNDLDLDAAVQQLAIVTGPNMSGKSTFIRQVAVIVLMAQIGSFVPADSAVLGIVDAIFTRVGLHDDLALGQSTFMVEMIETASILNSATPNSLIVLDEIGRGTSTYDGLAIAQAVAEYIHEASHLGAITLFATHYHEMTTLAQRLRRVVNLCVAVVEENEEVVFLHKIKPGTADRSYGVNVAQLAGIPDLVIERAKWLLRELEAEGQRENLQAMQGTLFDINQSDDAIAKSVKISDEVIVLDDIKEQIMSLDVDTMQPIEALNFLHSLNMKLHSAVNKSYERADL